MDTFISGDQPQGCLEDSVYPAFYILSRYKAPIKVYKRKYHKKS